MKKNQAKQSKPRRQKYNNKTFENQFGKWDSIHEYEIFLELMDRERRGEIKDLKRQFAFILLPAKFEDYQAQLKTKVVTKKRCLYRDVKYYADFVYTDVETGDTVVVDAKSDATRTDKCYILKKKMLYHFYNIKIVER